MGKVIRFSQRIEGRRQGGSEVLPYGDRYSLGVLAVVLGLLAGLAGFFLFSYVECGAVVGEFCFSPSKPFESAGLLLMGLGGVFVLVGIVLLAFKEAPGGTPSLQPSPPQQNPAVPEPSPSEPPEPTRPFLPESWTPKRTIIVVLVVAAVLIGGSVGAVLLREALSQPDIHVRDFDASLSGCGFFSSNQNVRVEGFRLANTGPAPGYVDVAVTVDGNVVRTYTFLVLSGEDRFFGPSEDALHTFSPSDDTIPLQGCDAQTVSYLKGNVWKA